MKALKLLIPSLLAAGVISLPVDARAAGEHKASHPTYRGTALTKRTFTSTAYTKLPDRENMFKWGTRLDAPKNFGPQTLGAQQPPASASVHDVPELSASAAGGSLALIGAGLLALTGRRKRKVAAQ